MSKYSRISFIFMLFLLSIFIQNAKLLDPKAFKNSGRLNGLPIDYSSGDHQSLLSSLVKGQEGGLFGLAERFLEEKLKTQAIQYNVSATCLNHTEIFLQELLAGQTWALKMIDAMGKPGSGIMDGNTKWLGSYDECYAVTPNVNISGIITTPFTGHYCRAKFNLGAAQKAAGFNIGALSIDIGTCMPSSCDNGDTVALLNTLVSLLPINTTTFPKPIAACLPQSLEFDTKAKIVIGVCSLFGLVMVLATAYDVIVVRWLKPRETIEPQTSIVEDYQERYKATNDYVSSNGEVKDSVKYIDNKGPEVCDVGNNGGYSNITNLDVEKLKTERPYKLGKLGQVLLSFSIYTNTAKIFNTSQPAGTLSAVNGIRFITMNWIILGHGFQNTLYLSGNMLMFATTMLKRFTFQVISNATVSVDTFFCLSGLLVSYLCLKELKKRNGPRHFNWGMYYFHRFWRLTPPYMLFLMFYVCLSKYFNNGPYWAPEVLAPDDCKDTWWKNILYINNIVESDKMCMTWSWYLANDMQFFIISPIMLLPLYYSLVFGGLSCLSLIVMNFIFVGVIASQHQLNPNIMMNQGPGAGDAIMNIYDRPWCRVGPYAVGVFTGYILYKTDCKLTIPKIVNLIGWLVSAAVGVAIVYGLYDESGTPQLNNNVSALYTATHRTVWTAAVCWVIVSCATGHGGIVNTLLSWKALVPLSRLTYCAYLVHPVVQFTYFAGQRTLLYASDMETAFLFCGYTCITYAVAFVVSLTFEAPMMGLEKAILGRAKNS